jgi:hypothetical protein
MASFMVSRCKSLINNSLLFPTIALSYSLNMELREALEREDPAELGRLVRPLRVLLAEPGRLLPAEAGRREANMFGLEK